jgi:1-aminocyclopropane-1-carboxylate deaminase/D-cysteine desulfhydrase-like pyridoxal-dependent ACC family enzyme
MKLSEQPRVELGSWPTPLVRARRLEAQLGCGPLLVKRDDLSGFAVAGSKARPLEFLLGAAIAGGFDTLVVGGVATSNFCQAAAVAARAAGLGCHIVLPGYPPPTRAASLAMALACGAEVSFSGGPREQLDERIEERAVDLNRGERSALAIPRGGANAIGSLGFVHAAHELAEQLATHGHDRARIVLAVGSGASIAGLVVSSNELGLNWTLTGVSVSRPQETMVPHLRAVIDGCAELLDRTRPAPAVPTLVQAPYGPHREPGTSTTHERSAALLALRTEGLVLDTDYTARAFPTVLRALAEDGPPVVFWHTGGLATAISTYLTATEATGTRRKVAKP